MYDYYRSVPGYISAIANITLVGGVISLFFNLQLAMVMLVACPTLWVISFLLNRRQVKQALPQELLAAVDDVKIGVYGRLSVRYRNQHGEEKSDHVGKRGVVVGVETGRIEHFVTRCQYNGPNIEHPCMGHIVVAYGLGQANGFAYAIALR